MRIAARNKYLNIKKKKKNKSKDVNDNFAII